MTGTVHDPPQGVWMLARSQFVGRSRLLNHGIHYPLRPVSRALEGRVYRSRTLFALTETGRGSIERTYPGTHTVYIPHLVRDRPTIRPTQAATIASVVGDEQRLTDLGQYADKTRRARSPSSTAAALAASWSDMPALGAGRG